MQLIIFYDGHCPLCLWEMDKLRALDVRGNIAFEDIQQCDFSERYPELDVQELDARIHGRLPDGRLITGLDVTHKAWQLVGRGWLYAPLRWPVIRWFADRGYDLFARYRYQISYLLTGKRRCETCKTSNDKTCSIGGNRE